MHPSEHLYKILYLRGLVSINVVLGSSASLGCLRKMGNVGHGNRHDRSESLWFESRKGCCLFKMLQRLIALWSGLPRVSLRSLRTRLRIWCLCSQSQGDPGKSHAELTDLMARACWRGTTWQEGADRWAFLSTSEKATGG